MNFLGEEGEERVRSAYRSDFKWLQQLKGTNIFRLNHDSPPEGA